MPWSHDQEGNKDQPRAGCRRAVRVTKSLVSFGEAGGGVLQSTVILAPKKEKVQRLVTKHFLTEKGGVPPLSAVYMELVAC